MNTLNIYNSGFSKEYKPDKNGEYVKYSVFDNGELIHTEIMTLCDAQRSAEDHIKNHDYRISF